MLSMGRRKRHRLPAGNHGVFKANSQRFRIWYPMDCRESWWEPMALEPGCLRIPKAPSLQTATLGNRWVLPKKKKRENTEGLGRPAEDPRLFIHDPTWICQFKPTKSHGILALKMSKKCSKQWEPSDQDFIENPRPFRQLGFWIQNLEITTKGVKRSVQ
jgi:hypothetical protein